MTYGRRPAARSSPTTRSRSAARSARSSVAAWWTVAPSSSSSRRPGWAGRPAVRTGRGGPSRPARAPAAAVSRAWFDQRRPDVTRRVGALGQRGADEVLEVAQLVPAEGQRQQVLALDPQLGATAEGRRQARQRRQRRRAVEQREPREAGRIGGPGRHAADGTRPYHRPMADAHLPGRPAHDDRPARRDGALDRDLGADGRVGAAVLVDRVDRTRRPDPRPSPRRRARPRSTSCPARPATPMARPAWSTRSRRRPATSCTSRPARSTSRRTRPSDRAARRRADPQLPGFARRSTSTAGRMARTTSPPRAEALGRRGRSPDLLAEHGLTDAPEAAFANDGWSGASLTRLVRPADGAAFVLKRTSWAVDWIARSTRDHALREGFVAATPLPLPEPLVAPYLGAAADGTAVAMLMPDLSDRLLGLGAGRGRRRTRPALERVLAAVARLHAAPWPIAATPDPGYVWPTAPAGRAAAAPRAPLRRATGGRRRRRRRIGSSRAGPPSTDGRRRRPSSSCAASTPTRDRCWRRSASCPRRASTAISSSPTSRRSRTAGSRSSTGR